MFRAVVWKEVREQGLIGLTLVVLGSGVLAGAAALADPPAATAPPADVVRHLGLGLLATLMLAVTAGVVCGGAVFAAEREAGTMGFLDALPVSRGRLWAAKLVAGLGLAAAQIGLLVAVAAALGLVPTAGWARAVGVFALVAFAWGAFGSTVARTTLGSVGVAIPAAVVTAVWVMLGVMLLSRSPATGIRPTEALAFLVLMFVIPVGLSARVFTAPDRLRAAAGADAPGAGGRAGGRFGARALVWLAVRQLRGPGPVIAAFALVAGLGMLAPGSPSVVTWYGVGLAAGVLAGVTAVADEQVRGVARFWGEQRLPVGRAWAVKVAVHALFAVGLLLLATAPLAVRAQATGRGWGPAAVLGSALFGELGGRWWVYLLVPAAYGFAAGHLAGLVFRKLVVACGVGGIVGGVGAAAWWPSLLAGGVAHWQVWAPPALALLTARLLAPAWAADRVAARRPLGILAGGCLAAALALAAGVGWRVLEVPDRPGGEDDIAYVGALPPVDVNRGGSAFRTAVERFTRAAAPVPEPDRPPAEAGRGGRRSRAEDRAADALRRGWPGAADPDLAAWLDRVFDPPREPGEEPWPDVAAAAAGFPVGIYEYPQLAPTGGGQDPTLPHALRMAVALLARGLQKQAGGDHAEFPRAARVVLALARTLRNGTVANTFRAGVEVESAALVAADAWLDRLPARAGADLLRDLAAALEDGDPAGPFDPTPHLLAERFVIREGQKAPSQSLPGLLSPANPDAAAQEVDLVALAWTVPWERERTRRLVGLGFENGPADHRLVAGRPGAKLLVRPRLPDELTERERALRLARRAAVLKLALRAHRADHGRYPDPDRGEGLGALEKGRYLRRVPPDPHAEDRPFGYRVARGGEVIQPSRPGRPGGPPGPPPTVPAGQPILWSVGPDGADQLGPALEAKYEPGRTDDQAYLVPSGPDP
jgi:ABC-type transport system involved in multi-copper enzyme maturation permease subunit